jgi:hypothetical protein
MLPSLSPQEFVAKWRKVELKERSASQSHFNNLCRLAGHPTPVEDDPTGERFTFEAGASKAEGGEGWADAWKKGFFAWEYKGKSTGSTTTSRAKSGPAPRSPSIPKTRRLRTFEELEMYRATLDLPMVKYSDLVPWDEPPSVGVGF